MGRFAGTTEAPPEASRQRQYGSRIRGLQRLNRSACAARIGNVRNDEFRDDHGFVMVFCGPHDAVARLAKPALDELSNEIVGFDDDDVTLKAHEVPRGKRTLGIAPRTLPDPIQSARLYDNMPAAGLPDDNRHSRLAA